MPDSISPTIGAPADAHKKGVLATGLLPVLQTLVALRFLMVLLASGILAFAFGAAVGHQPPQNALWIAAVLLAESTLLLIFVSWPLVRIRLDSKFLPVALGWFLLSPLVMDIISLMALSSNVSVRSGREMFAAIGIESAWMATPVILAAWQYGRKGWLWATGILVASSVILSAFFFHRDFYTFMGFALGSISRLGAITILGWVVVRLVDAFRSEHDALIRANQQLAQRAATIEQLAESRERNRLARALHDTLAHSLSGVSVQLQALDTLMQHDQPEAAKTQLKDTQATVRSGIKESRRAIEALRASPLEDLGLSEALRQLCHKQAEYSGIDFDCAIDDVPALDPLTEQAIYRVAEAALTNVVQHAAASKVWVQLAAEPALRLEIRDNGIGFDPGAVPTDRYGLTGMAERAELVGATLTVESMPGRGTVVRMEIGSGGGTSSQSPARRA